MQVLQSALCSVPCGTPQSLDTHLQEHCGAICDFRIMPVYAPLVRGQVQPETSIRTLVWFKLLPAIRFNLSPHPAQFAIAILVLRRRERFGIPLLPLDENTSVND